MRHDVTPRAFGRQPGARRYQPLGTRVRGRAIVLYDGECGFCLACARALRNLDRTHRLKLLGFDHPDAESLLAPLAPTERRRALHVVEPDGAMSSAGPALRLALGAAAGRVLNRGPMAWLVDRAYALVAQNRQYLRWIERVDRDDVG